ncbi:TfoX/Sxy family protein [Sphaerotilaceae bacterium SBD11-9]
MATKKPAAAKSEFAAHCLELLSPLGPARAGRMFSGHGFYVDDLFIALAIAERLYLKTDEQTRARFEAAGCEPFTYEAARHKRVSTSYWSAPEDAMESPMLMRPWARLAMEAALRARNTRPARKKRKPVPAQGGTKS